MAAGDPVKIQMENVTGTNEPDYGKMFTELKKFKKIK